MHLPCATGSRQCPSVSRYSTAALSRIDLLSEVHRRSLADGLSTPAGHPEGNNGENRPPSSLQKGTGLQIEPDLVFLRGRTFNSSSAASAGDAIRDESRAADHALPRSPHRTQVGPQAFGSAVGLPEGDSR